jgi:putative ABC transport system permease protein
MAIPPRFHRWPWKEPIEREIDDELAFHIEMRANDLISRGMTPADARREAARRLGDPVKVRASVRAAALGRDRHMIRTQYLAEIGQDAAFAGRQLLKKPSFALLAVFTLALGIGGTTSIFSALYAVVLKPLPLAEPERLFAVGETYQGLLGPMSVGIFVDTEVATKDVFEGLAAEAFTSFNLAEGQTPERVIGGRVTANFFDVLGARPAVGRVFTTDEDHPRSGRVVVLSHRLWQRRFGGAAVTGRDIRMNGAPYTVIGVMPGSFDLTTDSEDLWTPIAFTPAQRALHDEHYLSVFGRLKQGVTREAALAALEPVAQRIGRDFPNDAPHLKFSTRPFLEQLVGDYRSRLFVLMAAVAVVLLIACGNVANLLLARGSSRAREIAIRAAIGAGRGRIVRQLLAESVVLGGAAAVVGAGFAYGAVHALLVWSPPDIPRLEQTHVDRVALAFTVIVAFASSIFSGLIPAVRLARADVQSGLHEGRRGVTGGGFRDRLRTGLMAAEVALSLILLIGAGLLIRSAVAMQRVNPGFDPNGVFAARFSLPEQDYSDPARALLILQRIAEEARRVPGVIGASVTSYAAMGGGGGSNGLLPEGWDINRRVDSILRLTTPGFFDAMRVPLLKGRRFDERDRADSPRVMIVSETLARRAFPGQDPIGKRIDCCEPGPDGSRMWKVVVGVAGDVRSQGPSVSPRPEFYLPFVQAPRDSWRWFRTYYVVARTDGEPERLAPAMRAMMQRVDPDVPLFDVRTMSQRFSASLATARFNTLLLSALGMIGLLLAATGIYGVVAYLVSQRTAEIGVRMALGATAASVVRLILGQAIRPIAIGAAVGLAASFAASGVLSSQLFAVSRTDPLTITIVATTLIAVALVASAVPARRAATVDPTRALHAD